MIKITVPATSANMGAGFDSMGMALTLYNTLFVAPSDTIEICALDGKAVPQDKTNLVCSSAEHLFSLCGRPFKGIKIGQKSDIPQSRGLGSSSACIVGGLMAANALMGQPLSPKELLDVAVAIEGHPDNVAPALLGGFVVGAMQGSHLAFVNQPLQPSLRFAVLIPDFELKTSVARSVLPEQFSRADAVFNISRAALMAASLLTESYDNLRLAAGDRLHQPFRLPLIEGGEKALSLMEENGALCAFLSGAGPTLISIFQSSDAHYIKNLRKDLDHYGFESWQLLSLGADNTGAVCQTCEPFVF